MGPNGSGKSNVIDGLLFVFGKRAGKMRLNKVSELIHNSAGASDLPYCKVSVYFQEIVDHEDGEGYDVIPDSQLVVSRMADRDSKSTYFFNGKKCQFKDVAEFFASKGIDLDNNRFLILQVRTNARCFLWGRGWRLNGGGGGVSLFCMCVYSNRVRWNRSR